MDTEHSDPVLTATDLVQDPVHALGPDELAAIYLVRLAGMDVPAAGGYSWDVVLALDGFRTHTKSWLSPITPRS